MNPPKLRLARPDDAPAIHAAYVETAGTPGLLVSWPQEITLAGVQSEIAACTGDGGCFLAAQGEGGLLGHAYLSRMALQAVRHVYRLTTLVHPGQTGRGIGRLLLQGLHAWAAQQPSCRKIELLVRRQRAGPAPVRSHGSCGRRPLARARA